LAYTRLDKGGCYSEEFEDMVFFVDQPWKIIQAW
jgi:hypothetical protein